MVDFADGVPGPSIRLRATPVVVSPPEPCPKCIVEFNRLAARVQWGDAPLWCQLSNRFLSQIKDGISSVDKPDNLTDLCILAQSINACYWEYHNEIARETLVKKTQDKPNNKGKTSTTPVNQNSGNKNPHNSGTSGNTPTPTAPASTPKPAVTPVPKLGKDGRLTQEERQYHIDSNLCIFCGKSGHIANECLKAAAAKACAVTVNITLDNNSAATELKKLGSKLWHWTRITLALLVPLQSYVSMHLLFLVQTP